MKGAKEWYRRTLVPMPGVQEVVSMGWKGNHGVRCGNQPVQSKFINSKFQKDKQHTLYAKTFNHP